MGGDPDPALPASDDVIVSIPEHQRESLPSDAMSLEEGTRLWDLYKGRLRIEFPSPATRGRWAIESLGWIGFFPVSKSLAVLVKPNTPVSRLFEMIDIALAVRPEFRTGIYQVDSIEGMFDRIARYLSRRVVERARKGFLRRYVGRRRQLSVIRGRLDVGASYQYSEAGSNARTTS